MTTSHQPRKVRAQRAGHGYEHNRCCDLRVHPRIGEAAKTVRSMVNSHHLGGTTQCGGSPGRPEASYRAARAGGNCRLAINRESAPADKSVLDDHENEVTVFEVTTPSKKPGR